MPLELLLQAGLTPTQAEILGFLLSVDVRKASELVSALSRPRGVVYKGLEELVELGLVEKLEEVGSVARFRAEHPAKLESLFEAKEKLAQLEKRSFLANLPQITSQYNLVHHKPGVTYYEGKSGLRTALDSTLNSRTEILVFLDQNSIQPEDVFTDIGHEYHAQLVKSGIRQRILISGNKSAETSNSNHRSDQLGLTEVRYLGNSMSPFKTSMRIYDNKLSYQMIESQQTITTVIEDRNIYELNKNMFEYLWNTATE